MFCIAGGLFTKRTRNLEGGKEAYFCVSHSCHHEMQWFFTVTLCSSKCYFAEFFTPRDLLACSVRGSSTSGAPTLPHRLESQHHRRVKEKRGIFSPYFPQFQCARILVMEHNYRAAKQRIDLSQHNRVTCNSQTPANSQTLRSLNGGEKA